MLFGEKKKVPVPARHTRMSQMLFILRTRALPRRARITQIFFLFFSRACAHARHTHAHTLATHANTYRRPGVESFQSETSYPDVQK